MPASPLPRRSAPAHQRGRHRRRPPTTGIASLCPRASGVIVTTLAPAWRATLVSASWLMRYSASASSRGMLRSRAALDGELDAQRAAGHFGASLQPAPQSSSASVVTLTAPSPGSTPASGCSRASGRARRPARRRIVRACPARPAARRAGLRTLRQPGRVDADGREALAELVDAARATGACAPPPAATALVAEQAALGLGRVERRAERACTAAAICSELADRHGGHGARRRGFAGLDAMRAEHALGSRNAERTFQRSTTSITIRPPPARQAGCRGDHRLAALAVGLRGQREDQGSLPGRGSIQVTGSMAEAGPPAPVPVGQRPHHDGVRGLGQAADDQAAGAVAQRGEGGAAASRRRAQRARTTSRASLSSPARAEALHGRGQASQAAHLAVDVGIGARARARWPASSGHQRRHHRARAASRGAGRSSGTRASLTAGSEGRTGPAPARCRCRVARRTRCQARSTARRSRLIQWRTPACSSRPSIDRALLPQQRGCGATDSRARRRSRTPVKTRRSSPGLATPG